MSGSQYSLRGSKRRGNLRSVKDDLDLFKLKVDLLIPAVLESQITTSNVSGINPKIIIEAANGPITPEADAILNEKGVFIVPDILANAGGVAVSYFNGCRICSQCSGKRKT